VVDCFLAGCEELAGCELTGPTGAAVRVGGVTGATGESAEADCVAAGGVDMASFVRGELGSQFATLPIEK
jgi:hypothetical protein